jgi:hypothetical protein
MSLQPSVHVLISESFGGFLAYLTTPSKLLTFWKWIRKDVVGSYYSPPQGSLQCFLGGTEALHGKRQHEQPAYGPGIEPGTSRIRRTANDSTVMLKTENSKRMPPGVGYEMKTEWYFLTRAAMVGYDIISTEPSRSATQLQVGFCSYLFKTFS